MSLDSTTGSGTISGSELTNESILLERMRDEELQRLIPTIVFLAIISVLGVFGNGVVCHVYRTKYRLSNSQCFILCLSAIDLFTCSIAIPFEIVTVTDQYTFKDMWLCKLSRFFNTIGTMSSSFLLLVIAIDRYRKVCRPFGWQISFMVARILCGVSIAFGFVLALPAVFIYGKQTFDIKGMYVNGTECSTDDKWEGTMFPFLNAAVFGTLFVTGIVTICILYCFIGAEVKRHANTMPGNYSTHRNGSVPMVSLENGRNSSRLSGDFVNELNKKSKKESKRKSNYRMSKVKESVDLSWTGNNEDLSFSMEYTSNNTLPRGNNMDVSNGVKLSNKNEGSNTDSDDSGIKSDQVIHENVDLEQLETESDGIVLEIKPDVDNDESKTEQIPEQCSASDNENETAKIVADILESQAEIEDSQTAKIISPDDRKDTNESVTDTPSLGNYPSTSDDKMVATIPNKYTKNERSMSRISSIGSRISNAIRRMTSISSMTSSITIRKTQYLKQARARRTAFLMFMIWIAFVLSYLPHLFLMLMRQLQDGFVDDLSDTNKAVYKFFLRSYFLNGAINPIIYGVCDSRFRTACKEMFSCCVGKDTE